MASIEHHRSAVVNGTRWNRTGNCGMPSTVTRRGLLVFAFVLSTSLLGSAEPAGAQTAVRRAYETLRDAVYDSEALSRLQALYRDALHELEDAVIPANDRGIWRSRIEYLMARGFQACGEKQKAVVHFEDGLTALEMFGADEAPSEVWRMRSECISQLCLLKGLGYILANGTKVVAYAEKALALDSMNAAARVIVAASKVYPPPVFGGNPVRGIELMKEALALGTAERDDLFNIYSGIGLAHAKLKDTEEARYWLGKALELYPGNVYVRTEFGKLEN
ncbi:MAG: tetratricopeptide repeat protein [Spirochaetes bacterium]|nr:tetratricopeptide repeat protein [Spirochaetota bacterium]